MLQIRTKGSSELTMKTESRSFSTSLNLQTERMKSGPSALSLAYMMGMEAQDVLTFLEIICINSS